MIVICVGALVGLLALASAIGAIRLGPTTASETIGEGDSGTATARCKPGAKAVSGGFRGEFDAAEVVSGNSPQLQVYESRRRNDRGWAGSAYNQGATGELTTYVMCRAKGPKVSSNRATVEGTPFMSAARTGATTATCPAGTKVVSGGFDNPDFRVTGDYANDNRLVPYISRRSGPRKWTVEAANYGGADGTLVAYAYCLDVPSPRTKRDTATFAAPLDGVRLGSAVARCPRGQRAVSGGFKLTGLEPLMVASRKVGSRRWKASASVGYPGQATLTAYAYCES